MKMQNTYPSSLDIVFLKPVMLIDGPNADLVRKIWVMSERGEFLWESRNDEVAKVIARCNGLTPVSVH